MVNFQNQCIDSKHQGKQVSQFYYLSLEGVVPREYLDNLYQSALMTCQSAVWFIICLTLNKQILGIYQTHVTAIKIDFTKLNSSSSSLVIEVRLLSVQRQ